MKRFTIFVYLLAVFSACNTIPRSTPSISPDLTPVFNQPNPTNLSSLTSPTTPTEKNTQPRVNPTANPIRAIPLDVPIHWIPKEGGIPVTSHSPNGSWVAETIFSEARLLMQVIHVNNSLTWLVIDKKGPLSVDYPFPSQFRWSADDRYMYYYGTTNKQYLFPGGGICDIGGINVDPLRLDLKSGEITPLTFYRPGELQEFSISPNATIFAYFDPDRNRNMLTLQNLETGDKRALQFDVPTGQEWAVGEIVWAPDESALAFSLVAAPCNSSGVYPTSIIVVDLNAGIARTVISADPELNWQFKWIDSQVLLLHEENGAPRHINVKDGLAIFEEQMPILSPNEGDNLGWLSFITEHESYPAAYAVRANGRDIKQLSGDLTKLFADLDQPRIEDWSPDGSWIAFTGLPPNGNDGDIYLARIATLERKNLTDSPSMDGAPDWAPDGKQIAYFSQLPGWNSKPSLYLIQRSAEGQRTPSMLTNTPTFDSEPAWSPDGSRIAFVRYRQDQNGTDLYVLNLKDLSIEQLTDDTAGESDLVWSPDGKRIAFTSDINGNSHIYTIHSNGSDVVQVTKDVTGHTRVLNNSPTWSPNGKYITYISTRDGQAGIYIARADGTGEWLVIERPVWANSLYWGIPIGLSEP